MISIERTRKFFPYGFAALLVFASGLVVGQRTANAQSLTVDFMFSGNPNSITSANTSMSLNATDSGTIVPIEVWVVVTGNTNTSLLGLQQLYYGGRNSVSGGNGAFSVGASSSTNGSYVSTVGVVPGTVTQQFSPSTSPATGPPGSALYPFNYNSGLGSTSGGENNVGDYSGKGINDLGALNVGTDTPDTQSNSLGSETIGGGSQGGIAVGSDSWAWEISTVNYQLGTYNTSGNSTIFTPAAPTVNGTKYTYTIGGAPQHAGFTVGSAVTFTSTSGSTVSPGLTLAAPSPAMQVIGSTISLSGTVTDTGGSGNYTFTSLTDNTSTNGTLTGFSTQTGTATPSTPFGYTVNGTVNSNTAPGATVTYNAMVSDGNGNTATNPSGTTVEAVANRYAANGAYGFSIGTATLNSGVPVYVNNSYGTSGAATTLTGTVTINGGTLTSTSGGTPGTNLLVASSGSANGSGFSATGLANGTGNFNNNGLSGTWTISGAAPSAATILALPSPSLNPASNVISGMVTLGTTGQGIAGESDGNGSQNGTSNSITVPYTYTVVAGATADNSGSSSTFGTAVTANVLSSTPNGYAGLASQALAETGSGGGGLEGTIATILMGANSGNFASSSATVGMAWRTRLQTEVPDNDSVNSGFPNNMGNTGYGAPLHGLPLISDVVDLFGMANESGQTDPFVFQMSYNPATLIAEGATKANLANKGNVYLASLNASNIWVNTINLNNAIDDSTTTTSTKTPNGMSIIVGVDAAETMPGDSFITPYIGSFLSWEDSSAAVEAGFETNGSNLGDFIGVFGVDPTNDEAWAIVNHNSDFAVVPEPSTIVLGAFGLLGGIWALRRRKATGYRLQA